MKEEQEVSRPLSSIVGSESSNKLPECELYEKEAEASEWKTELLNAKMENKRLLEELNAVKATEERLRTSLEKAEADLEGLSKAYTALDSYAEELRVKLDALESRNHDYSPKVSSSLSTSKDDESAMEDLLVCLALEEAKVAQLERELALLKGTNV